VAVVLRRKWCLFQSQPVTVIGEIQAMNNRCQSSAAAPGPEQDPRTWSALELYLKLVPGEFFDRLVQGLKLRRNRSVFTLPVIIWLMAFQRLSVKGTLWLAVQQVRRGLPSGLIPQPGKRLREKTVSGHTGGYNQARQQLPIEVVERVNDEVFQQLTKTKRQRSSGVQMFILDGSTLLMSHQPSLLKAYPPSHNQHGESHWPVMRVLVAHDVHCGMATRPQWGPVHGPKAVSEQGLTEQLLRDLPEGAVVMGDQNFGVFSVAWAAQQRNHPVLLRLTPARAKRAFGSVLCSGTDQSGQWKPSRWDRDHHPRLPVDASVHGRLIVRKVYPSDGSGPLKLYLFTTLGLASDDITQLYGLRWNVETDLRTLKKTIRLEMLDCKTPDMVAKELILAIMAYNLVRAVINESAQRTQMNPRQYSFSRVQDVLNTWLPYIAGISSESKRQVEHERMMQSVAQCKLYKRKKAKSYPREIWLRRRNFPTHKVAPVQKKAQDNQS
jgi:putative transposase